MIELKNANQIVTIDAGELTGYRVNDHEFIHQKGSRGWRSSDTEMFPIIGPTAEAGFRVQTPRGEARQDQHGLLREMDYELAEQTGAGAVFQKVYHAGTPVDNSKYPGKSTEAQLAWPYDFKFMKTFEVREAALFITFQISGEAGMPFMLGYHPAFKLYAEKPVIYAKDKSIQLAEVLAAGSQALPVLDCRSITLQDEKTLTISTEGFDHFMLWTEVPNMVCIEPITFYPYQVAQNELHTGFQLLTEPEHTFRVRIQAGG
jgi:galactose mutarotase-like enzyme